MTSLRNVPSVHAAYMIYHTFQMRYLQVKMMAGIADYD